MHTDLHLALALPMTVLMPIPWKRSRSWSLSWSAATR